MGGDLWSRWTMGGGLHVPRGRETYPGFKDPFADDLMTDESTGVTSLTTSPTKDGSNPLFTSGTETDAWDRDKLFCAGVVINGEGWHMIYSGYDTSLTYRACYATSDDGITWTKPNLGLVTYGGNTNNNIVVDGEAPESAFYDDHMDKWVLVADEQHGSGIGNIYTSNHPAGGFEMVKTINLGSGAEIKALIRRTDGRWVMYWVDGHSTQSRSIYASLSDTTDIAGTYTDQGIILPSPGSTAQYYRIAPWRDGSVIWACIPRYNRTTEQIHTDLFASSDGLFFSQVKADWLPRGASTAWDDEMVFGGSAVTDGDDWHIYYMGSPTNHAASIPRNSKIGRATIKRSRAAGFTGTGSTTTRTLTVADAATLLVNANASGGGTLKIELQDAAGSPITNYAEADFDTISTDVVDQVPTWGGSVMPTGQELRLKFVTSSAAVYSYSIGEATANYFDPVNDITWHTAFWADGDEFLTLSPTADSTIETWPDEASTHDASQSTGTLRPWYRYRESTFGNRPVIETVSGDYMTTAAWTALTQPNTIVAVASMTGTGTAAGSFAFDGLGSGNQHALFHRNGNDNVSSFAGAQINGGTKQAGAHLFIVTFNGASSAIERDGTSIGSGNAGSEALTGLTLFCRYSVAFFGEFIAFLGVVDGTLTSSEKADLLAWSRAYYGTP